MDAEFLGEKLRQIDQEAQRKKAATAYILDLVQDNEAVLSAVFVQKGTESHEVQELIYQNTIDTLNHLAARHIRPAGLDVSYRTPNAPASSYPPVVLGWAELVPYSSKIDEWPPDKKFPHFLRLTHKGKSTIDGYRAALGLAPVDEVRESNREQWNAAIEEAEKARREEEISS